MPDTTRKSRAGGVHHYKIGFYSAVAVLGMGSLLCVAALYAYDKSPLDVWNRVIAVFDGADELLQYGWLPDYYGVGSGALPHSYDTDMETVDEFKYWKKMPGGVLARYQDAPQTHDVSYDATLTRSTEQAEYTLYKYTMLSYYDDIIFYEAVPSRLQNGPQEYNAVFVIPGRGNGGAADVMGMPGPHQDLYYHDAIAETLVQAGYAVYTIELHGYGERRPDAGSWCSPESECAIMSLEHQLDAWGIDIDAIWRDEATAVLSYIESRPYIRNVAVAGLSLGSELAAEQAVINGDVVDAVVLASGPAIGSVLYGPLSLNNHRDTYDNMALCCDTVDVWTTIAPLPMYVSFGQSDSIAFQYEVDTGHAGDILRDAYELHDADDNFSYIIHDGGHGYDTGSMLVFLSKHMGGSP